MKNNTEITVLSETVRVQRVEKEEFISLTDIAKFRNPDAPADIIKNWLRSRSTIDLLGLWEKLNNTANLENLNALFINEGMPQPARLQKLNRIAIE